MQSHKKLHSLDAVRAVACLWVWVSHIRVATQYFKGDRYNYMQILTAWGHEMVLLFFILSGIVINLSSKNKVSRQDFFKKRALRIYPIYLAVLIACYSINYFISGNPVDKHSFLGNVFLLATLQGYLFTVMPYNAAVWSVSCEAFFYMVFGLLYTPKRLTSIWIWFAIATASHIFLFACETYQNGWTSQLLFMSNSSFIWLLGYLLFEYRARFKVSLSFAACSALMIPLVTRLHQFSPNIHNFSYSVAAIYFAPTFIYPLQNYKAEKNRIEFKLIWLLPFYLIGMCLTLNYSDSLYKSKVVYTLLPFAGLCLNINHIHLGFKFIYQKVLPGLLFIARISYPLYLIHMPVMYITFHFLPTQKIAGVAIIISVSLLISLLLEKYLFEIFRRSEKNRALSYKTAA